MNPIRIRPARPADASLAARLFQLSMGSLADYLFDRDPHFAGIGLTRLFSGNAGRFGFKSAFVAEADDETVGLLVAYPGKKLPGLDLQTLPYLFPALGVPRAFDFLRKGISLPGGREAESDEYYISNLGVLPSAQGCGIGSRLLEYADGIARSVALRKCSLLVSLKNEGARRLYERHGYRIMQTVPDKNKAPGYHRMVKELA